MATLGKLSDEMMEAAIDAFRDMGYEPGEVVDHVEDGYDFDPLPLTHEEQTRHERKMRESCQRIESEWNRRHPPLTSEMIELMKEAEENFDDSSIIDFSPRRVPHWALMKKGPSKKKRHPKGGLF